MAATKPNNKTADNAANALEAAYKLAEAFSARPDGASELRAVLSIKKGGNDNWRGAATVPPGSILETIVEAFRAKTDIPLELPLFAALSIVGAILLRSTTIVEEPKWEHRTSLRIEQKSNQRFDMLELSP